MSPAAPGRRDGPGKPGPYGTPSGDDREPAGARPAGGAPSAGPGRRDGTPPGDDRQPVGARLASPVPAAHGDPARAGARLASPVPAAHGDPARAGARRGGRGGAGHLSILHAIARLNVGGAARSVLELAAEQRERGHEVAVVAGTLAAGEESMEYLASELGVHVVRLPALRREVSLRHDALAVRALRRLLARRVPDVLHTHTAKAGATGRIASLLPGGVRPRATVHSFHGHVLRGYFDPHRERIFIRVERTLARRTGALVAVSEEVRDDLVALGVAPASTFVVVPYGFDLSGLGRPADAERARLRDELGAGEDTFVVGWAGRLTAIKRPEDLVHTLARLVEQGVDAILVAAGDGPERPAVEALAARLGVAARCRLLGYRRDVGRWYGALDAFVLTSANEGTPVVAIEALASECPVVATDAGGTATVVRDGETGHLVPVGDTAALAARLAELARDPAHARRLARRGARDVRERFAMGRMADELDDLYARLLAGP